MDHKSPFTNNSSSFPDFETEILETIKPGANFAASTDFIEEHLLESMEILQLVSELNEEFDINITLPYIKPENFIWKRKKL